MDKCLANVCCENSGLSLDKLLRGMEWLNIQPGDNIALEISTYQFTNDLMEYTNNAIQLIDNIIIKSNLNITETYMSKDEGCYYYYPFKRDNRRVRVDYIKNTPHAIRECKLYIRKDEYVVIECLEENDTSEEDTNHYVEKKKLFSDEWVCERDYDKEQEDEWRKKMEEIPESIMSIKLHKLEEDSE